MAINDEKSNETSNSNNNNNGKKLNDGIIIVESLSVTNNNNNSNNTTNTTTTANNTATINGATNTTTSSNSTSNVTTTNSSNSNNNNSQNNDFQFEITSSSNKDVIKLNLRANHDDDNDEMLNNDENKISNNDNTKVKNDETVLNTTAKASTVPQTLISCLNELQNNGKLISWKIRGQGENLTVKVTWNSANNEKKSRKYQRTSHLISNKEKSNDPHLKYGI